MRFVAAMLAALVGLAIIMPRAAFAQVEQTGGYLRVIHAAADVPAVDVLVDGQRAIESQDYFSVRGPLAVAPGTHTVSVVPAGAGAEAAVLSEVVTVDANDGFTIAVIGGADSLEGLVLEDSISSPEADEARVRIIHAAPGADLVDVKVAGAAEPFLTDVPFGAATYVDVPAGTYALDLLDAESGASALRTIDLTFIPGWTYTLVVTGASAESLWVQANVDRVAQ
jgi:hypothetical protein